MLLRPWTPRKDTWFNAGLWLCRISLTRETLSDLCMFSLFMRPQFVFLFADCVAASTTSPLSLCAPQPSVSLLWQTRRVRRNEENLAGYLIQMCQLRENANAAPGCISVIQQSTLNIATNWPPRSLHVSSFLLIYFLMPSVCFNVTLRPPKLNRRQSAGRHWLYRLHCLQIPPSPSDRSGVFPSPFFYIKLYSLHFTTREPEQWKHQQSHSQVWASVTRPFTLGCH